MVFSVWTFFAAGGVTAELGAAWASEMELAVVDFE
jgi:hypothetical protein